MRKKYHSHQLLQKPFEPNLPIAFVCSPRLGDTLIGFVTIKNLMRNGFSVDVYGDFACQLREWFPHFNVYPSIKTEDQFILERYDTVLHMFESNLSNQLALWHPHSVTMSHSPYYSANMTMIDIQVYICCQEFGLMNTDRTNDIVPLPGLTHKKHSHRVVVHPTSSMTRKNWPAKKFVKLATLLMDEGYDVDFILPTNERNDWLWVTDEGINLPSFSSLSSVATWLYESGYFIGNDSGLGHLASNLDIPTISIILRKGVAKQWRPSWSKSKVVLSPSWVNPRPIKEKLWKLFTKVATVKEAFDELVRDTEQ